MQVAHVVSAAVFAYPALGQISRRLDHAAVARRRVVFIDPAALRAVPLLFGIEADGDVRVDHAGLIGAVGWDRRDRVLVENTFPQIFVGTHVGSHADGTGVIETSQKQADCSDDDH